MLRGGCVAALLIAACGEKVLFRCTTDASCSLQPTGQCLAASSGTNWCAYPADDCPSGVRWSDLAGDGLANMCVGVSDAGPDSTVADAPAPPDSSQIVCSTTSECPTGEYCRIDRCTSCADLSTLAFHAPEPVTEVNTDGRESNLAFSGDGTKLFLAREDQPGPDPTPEFWEYTEADGLWVSGTVLAVSTPSPSTGDVSRRIASNDGITYYVTYAPSMSRPTIYRTTRSGSSFGSLSDLELGPSGRVYLSSDGATMYFDSDRASGDGTNDFDIWVTTYNAGAWTQPGRVAGVNSELAEGAPSIAGAALLFDVGLLGQQQAYVSNPIGSAPTAVAEINTLDSDTTGPVLTRDMCAVYFVSDRAGGAGQTDVWRAARR
jgi:hypothetical protein